MALRSFGKRTSLQFLDQFYYAHVIFADKRGSAVATDSEVSPCLKLRKGFCHIAHSMSAESEGYHYFSGLLQNGSQLELSKVQAESQIYLETMGVQILFNQQTISARFTCVLHAWPNAQGTLHILSTTTPGLRSNKRFSTLDTICNLKHNVATHLKHKTK